MSPRVEALRADVVRLLTSGHLESTVRFDAGVRVEHFLTLTGSELRNDGCALAHKVCPERIEAVAKKCSVGTGLSGR